MNQAFLIIIYSLCVFLFFSITWCKTFMGKSARVPLSLFLSFFQILCIICYFLFVSFTTQWCKNLFQITLFYRRVISVLMHIFSYSNHALSIEIFWKNDHKNSVDKSFSWVQLSRNFPCICHAWYLKTLRRS